jgi:hypothetical protein
MRRAGARAGILLALVITVAGGVGLSAGLGAGSPLSTSDVIRDTLPGPDVPEGWLQVQTRPAADRDVQRDAGTVVLEDMLGDDVLIETLIVGEAGTDFERAAWRITPAPAALTPAGLDRLARSLPRVLTEFRSSEAAEGGAIVTGGLVEAVAAVADAARATSAILPIPIALLCVLAWFAVLQLSRLLGSFRLREAQLLRARGLSPLQSAVLASAEGGVVAVLGVAVGVLAAGAVLAVLWPEAGVAALVALWPLWIAALLGVAVTVAAAQTAAARGGRTAAAGRVARAASPALAVLLVAVAAVLVWQAATTAADGWDAWTVIVTILAPTVGTAALAVIALVVFGPLTALAASLAARARGMSPSYPARHVARRLSAFSVAVALVVIATAGAVLAGGYAATWTGATARAAQLAAGAPLRAVLDPATPADVERARAVGTAAAPAYAVAVVAGDVSARLVALPQDAIPDVVTDLPGLAEDVQAALDGADAGGVTAQELPEGTTAVRLSGAVTAAAPEIAAAATARAWVVDGAGTPIAVALELSADDGRFTATGTLPEGLAPWGLVSVEVARGDAFATDAVVFTDLSIAALQDQAETPLELDTIPSASLHPPRGSEGAVRSAVVFAAAGARPERVPAVVTDAFASALDLAAGDELDLRVDGSGRQYALTVADVVPVLPGIGSGAGVFADLDALVVASAPMASGADTAPAPPTAGQLWASDAEGANDAADTAAALSAALGVPVETVEDPGATAAGGLATLWPWAATGGAVLAGVALVALLWAAARQRAGEVLVLRALGIPPRRQARLRSGESGFVLVLAAVLGAAGGVALSLALIPGLVSRTIVAAAGTPALRVDPLPVAATAGILLVAFVVAATGAAVTVRRQGASTRVEEAAP